MTDPITRNDFSNRGTLHNSDSSHANTPSESSRPASLSTPPRRPRRPRPHSIHVSRFPIASDSSDLRLPPFLPNPNKPSHLRIELRKLASRENAKRVLGSVFSSFSTSTNSSTSPSAASPSATNLDRSTTPDTTRRSRASINSTPGNSSGILARRSIAGPVVGDNTNLPMSRPPLTVDRGTPRNSIVGSSTQVPSNKAGADNEKPVASGNGISCSILLAEPSIYLTGLDHEGATRESASTTTALLRGKLQLNVVKSAKIKSVSLKFTGRARTLWPEGIPPEKTETFEEESFRTQVIPFFNAMYEGAESGYGTLCNYILRDDKSASSSVTNLSLDPPSPSSNQNGFSFSGIAGRSRSNTVLSAKEIKRLSLQSNQSRSFTKSDSPFGPTPQQKGFKVFHPGIYEYSFELPIDNNMPETTKLPLATVHWDLEAVVERAGTFKANLIGKKEVPVIRSPSEDSLELVEPISISRRWEDQLHYEIMISGKSFPLGTRIPIAFKLTPLAKVQVHKLKVYVSENIEYFARNKKVTRRDVTRKILLLEKSAGKPVAKEYAPSEVTVLGGEPTLEERQKRRDIAMRRRTMVAERSGGRPEPLPEPTENLLGDIDLGVDEWLGPTEIEMAVQLPTCEMMERDRAKRMAHDCTWKNAEVHHWIKIVMRISRLDTEDPTGKKRRHFEISIDSPISILNCRATQANLALPEYSGLNVNSRNQQRVCGCPNAAASEESPPSSSEVVATLGNISSDDFGTIPDLTRPPQAHLSTNAAAGVQRPIHMLRSPSFNPPPFDFEQPPPPIATPPPLYDHVIGTPSHDGLADYFARLGEWDDDHTDDEDTNRATSRGRVNVANPRTPGGRIARSMDIDRNFMFNPQTFNDVMSRGVGENRVSAT